MQRIDLVKVIITKLFILGLSNRNIAAVLNKYGFVYQVGKRIKQYDKEKIRVWIAKLKLYARQRWRQRPRKIPKSDFDLPLHRSIPVHQAYDVVTVNLSDELLRIWNSFKNIEFCLLTPDEVKLLSEIEEASECEYC